MLGVGYLPTSYWSEIPPDPPKKQYKQLSLLSVVHQNLMVDPTAENATHWSQDMQKSSPY